MCGLFGWVSRERPLSDADRASARRATALLAHRGPDNQGEWSDERTYMGHRRLNIIDLSASANQPMDDPSGRYAFAYNGEIYNYLELRPELEAEGCAFHTRSDTEVFLAALIRWGTGALTRVDGMFAAALHDRQTGAHLLMRDPLGQKPMYYAEVPGGVVYASELRALLALDVKRWTIDRDAFLRYLMLGYYSWDETPIAGIRKLLPGCVLRIGREGARVERYWDSVPGQEPLDLRDGEALETLDELLNESCVRAMRSDVPYGVLLSGGLDSTLVASYCRRANPDLRAISVAMAEPDFDESHKATLVCRHLGIAEAHRVTMSDESVREALRDVLASIDEPHADPGFVNAHFLSRAARRHMVVALAGDGGDELFAGYPPFAALGLERLARALPAPAIALGRAAAGALPASDRYLGLQFKALAFLQGFPASNAVRYPLWLSAIGLEDLRRLVPGRDPRICSAQGEAGTLFGGVQQLLAEHDQAPSIDRLLYYYQKVFLPEFVCMHTDRAAMQSSLEVRSPFLSRPLVEFANRLPARFKQRGSELKVLLRRLAEAQGFPAEITAQRKQGFTFPLARWLKTTLRPEADALATLDSLDDLGLDRRMIQQQVDDHLSGRRNNYRLLYHLIVFGAWRRHHPGLAIE